MSESETRPLSRFAYDALDVLGLQPEPTCMFGAATLRKLREDKLIEIVDLPSPYSRGRKNRLGIIPHAKITTAGRNAFDSRPAEFQA